MILPALSQQCLDGFALLNSRLPAHQQSRRQSLANSFGAYKAWVGNSCPGTVQQSISPLSELVRDDEQLHARLVRLLNKLSLLLAEAVGLDDHESESESESDSSADSDATQKAATTSGSTPDLNTVQTALDRALNRIHGTVDSLFRLSTSLQIPTRHDQVVRGDLVAPEDFQAHDLKQIRTHFPGVKEYLVKRIANAISRRRQFFQYRANRFASSAEVDDGVWLDETSNGSVGPITESAVIILPFEVEPGDFLAPNMPSPDANLSQEIQCPVCYGNYWTVDSQFWRSHISDDMTPYLCTWEKCPTATRMYSDRGLWQHHEESSHHRQWTCPFECASSFDQETLLEDHPVADHSLSEDPESLQVIAQASSQPDSSKFDRRCPLCEGLQQSVSKWYFHVGEHYQQLAMLSLPQHLTKLLSHDHESNDDSDSDQMSGEPKESLDGDISSFPPTYSSEGQHTADPGPSKGAFEKSKREAALSTILEEPSMLESGSVSSEEKTSMESSSITTSATMFFDDRQKQFRQNQQGTRFMAEQDRYLSKPINVEGRTGASLSNETNSTERGNSHSARDQAAEAMAQSQEIPSIDVHDPVPSSGTDSERPRAPPPTHDIVNESTKAHQAPRPAAFTYAYTPDRSQVDVENEKARRFTLEMQESVANHPPVRLLLAPGFWYKIPFQAAKTWESMLCVLNEVYRYSPNHKELIANGKFELMDSEGSIVLPSFWQFAVKPALDFSIRFAPAADRSFRTSAAAHHEFAADLNEPVIPLGVPFGGASAEESSREPSKKNDKNSNLRPEEPEKRAKNPLPKDAPRPASPLNENPKLLDHQYRESDSDGYYPDLKTAYNAYTRPSQRRQATSDLGDIADRIVEIEGSEFGSRPQSMAAPSVASRPRPLLHRASSARPSTYSATSNAFGPYAPVSSASSARDPYSYAKANPQKSDQASPSVHFDVASDRNARAKSSRQTSRDQSPPTRRRSERQSIANSGYSSQGSKAVSAPASYSDSQIVIEDSGGRRIAHMTKAGQWEIDKDNSKGKVRDSLKKQERRADAAEAYQKETSGGKSGQHLTAEHVKDKNRAAGSTDPPEYDEVGSNTKAEVSSKVGDLANDPGSSTAVSKKEIKQKKTRTKAPEPEPASEPGPSEEQPKDDADDWGSFAKKSKKKRKAAFDWGDVPEPSPPPPPPPPETNEPTSAEDDLWGGGGLYECQGQKGEESYGDSCEWTRNEQEREMLISLDKAKTNSTNEPTTSVSTTTTPKDSELAIVIRDEKTPEEQDDRRKGPERATVTTPVTEDDDPE